MPNNHETHHCQNCRTAFTIAPEDFEFYERLKVPSPTLCPDCRMQRRMAFRNERALHSRKCNLCDKQLISQYATDTIFPVYCSPCWWSDKWSPTKYAREFDPAKPFLTQLKEMQDQIPRPHANNASNTDMVNSDYTNCAGAQKNCYLVFGADTDEDCYYSHYINWSKDCVDNLYCIKCESCYQCLDIENCYNLSYSQSCLDCHDSMFLYDCRNCSDCLGCSGLRNKQYYIFNKPYKKEEYLNEKAVLKLDTRSGLNAFKEKFLKELYFSKPRKFYHGQNNQHFSGDYIANCENTYHSFYIKKSRNCKYTFWSNNALDTQDYFAWGDLELCYEIVSSGYKTYRCKFIHASWTSLTEVEYSNLCFSSCANLFGCIGLRGKKFCIMNKQYSEKEYHELRSRIISQMNEIPYKDHVGLTYKYGEFFPIGLSPFPYHDSVAQEHFPLTREEILKRGYVWREPEARSHTATVKPAELPDSIEEVEDDMLKQIIACAHDGKCADQCTIAFKLVPPELAFYRKKNIPLPTLCPNCRHAERVRLRNPLKLWPRGCDCLGDAAKEGRYKNTTQHFHGSSHCPNKFETAYAPERQEIVYCEQCYQSEVV